MMNDNKKTLYAKIARIMGALGRLQKDAKNSHFNYEYVSDNAVYTACREQLAAENVAVLASMVDVQREGKTTLARFEFTLACGDTGETITCPWYAEAADSQDKGVNKAATAALKYWLLKTFIIPTGDDPDAVGLDHPRQQPASKPTAKPAPAPKQPAPVDEPSALDEHLGPKVEYDPTADTSALNPGTWDKLNAWMCGHMDNIKASEHAVNALWKALGESADSLFDDEAKVKALRATVEEKNFTRLFKAKLTVADVMGAIRAHYADAA